MPELINTTWGGLEAAQDAFPLGEPVEVISGEVCTATEYREVQKGFPTRKCVEVWGTVE